MLKKTRAFLLLLENDCLFSLHLFVLLQELSLKSLEREFDECKDFDKRRQIRSTIKDLRTKIRGTHINMRCI